MAAGSDRTHRVCVEQFGFNFDEIAECAQSDFAVRQQLQFERLTTPVLQTTNWVPTVLYDGKITDYSHTGRSPALKDVLCELLHDTNPACKTNKMLRNFTNKK